MSLDLATPEVEYDHGKHCLIPDWAGLCHVPFDPEGEGLKTFRALLVPKGKVLHLEDVRGQYLVDGDWQVVRALQLVHFAPTTARKPEFLLCFMDFSAISNSASGMYVETLQLPLQVKKNVYQSTAKISTIADVVGFSTVPEKQLPWIAHMKPTLSKIEMLNVHGIYNSSTLEEYLGKPLEGRLEIILKQTNAALTSEVSDILKQDARLGERQRAQFQARVDKIREQLVALPLSAYDLELSCRVHSLEGVSAGVKTPHRQQVSQGTAEAALTRVAEMRPIAIDVDHSPPSPTSPVPPPEGMGEEGEGGGEEGAVVPTLSPVNQSPKPAAARSSSSRLRTATDKFQFKHAPAPKKSKTSRQDKKVVEPPPINPRTKEPYKRGGPYSTKAIKKNATASKLKALIGADDDDSSDPALLAAVPTLKLQVQHLKLQVEQLKGELAKAKHELAHEKSSVEARLANARLTSAHASAHELLEKYKEGIRDGANISKGRVPTPLSFGGATPNSTDSY